MRRALSGIVVAFLLVACVALAVLWVRSHLRSDIAYRETSPVSWSVSSSSGGLTVGRCTYSRFRPKLNSGVWHYYTRDADWGAGRESFLGFGHEQIGSAGAAMRIEHWTVPYWALVTTTGAMPVALLLKRLKERNSTRRILSGRCSACGYDLRATPQRCPECGKENQSGAPAPA